MRAQIEGIAEQRLVVGADIQHDGQHAIRVDTSAERVERRLADTVASERPQRLDAPNQDAADALIADAEDALAVGQDHQIDVVRVAALGQDLLDAVAIRVADEDAVGASPAVRVRLYGLADRRRVDDR